MLAGILAHHAHFYPRSPCGERPADVYYQANAVDISIHALLAESDHLVVFGSDCRNKFLSTLSLRRATVFVNLCNIATTNFYPRSPCGERLKHLENRAQDLAFLSTLSLRRAT